MRQRYFFMPNNYKNLEKKYQKTYAYCVRLLAGSTT